MDDKRLFPVYNGGKGEIGMKLAMWVFMLTMNLLIPAVMIGFGRMFMKKPPKKVNGFYGYRTSRSMKNQDTWDFAQRYMGEVWWKWGWIMSPPVALAQALTLLCPDVQSMCNWSLVPTTVETVVLAVSIIPVERALKRYFDKDGKRL